MYTHTYRTIQNIGYALSCILSAYLEQGLNLIHAFICSHVNFMNLHTNMLDIKLKD